MPAREKFCESCGAWMGELQVMCSTPKCLASRGVVLQQCQYCEGRGFVMRGLEADDCQVCGGWGALASDEPEDDKRSAEVSHG
jgi:hypothetical protein